MPGPLVTHPKKRLEIFIEAPVVERLTDLLAREGVTGYTVFEAVAGAGSNGPWSLEGTVSAADRMLAVVCITDAARVPSLLESVYALVSRQIGIVAVSDVTVVRAERF